MKYSKSEIVTTQFTIIGLGLFVLLYGLFRAVTVPPVEPTEGASIQGVLGPLTLPEFWWGVLSYFGIVVLNIGLLTQPTGPIDVTLVGNERKYVKFGVLSVPLGGLISIIGAFGFISSTVGNTLPEMLGFVFTIIFASGLLLLLCPLPIVVSIVVLHTGRRVQQRFFIH